ncbi:MAG TPA: CYTH domain-containing protein [Steroidobacteraceae bacterium]
MATEIERKFRLSDPGWRAAVSRKSRLRQGYIANTPRASVRVRLADDRGWLSVKSMAAGMSRDEYEVAIPASDADEMLERLCQGGHIEKWRHIVAYQGHEWEIDEFLGDNAGLVIAELELDSEDAGFARPPWLGPEVTHDERYYNIRLAQRPFRDWPENQPEHR